MNKENIKLWIEALESGKYRQGHNRLMLSGDSRYYCCLGVACEVFRLKTGLGRWVGNQPSSFFIAGEHDAYELPGPVAEWYNGDQHIPVTLLIEMNDSHDMSFNDIAKWLRGQYGIPKDERQ